ncbi:MAG TPA: hypothetical protein VGA42_08560 [Gemmatimonadales bacterium]
MVRLSGSCHLTFAFEVGQNIDLEAGERCLGPTERQTVRSRQRVPRDFEYSPPPLRLGQEPPALTVAGRGITRVDVVLYDFGAAAVNYALPYTGSLSGLVPVSVELQETEGLARDARTRLEGVVATLGEAITRARVAELVEDYLIIQIDTLEDGADARELVSEQARETTAQILRGVGEPLAAEEVDDALRLRLSFGRSDLTLVDWNAAVIFDPEPEETRVLLEFANVQLLELRHLDAELDRALDEAYESLGRSERGWLGMRPPASAMRRLGELQVDGAVLFERVSNALKLVGDRFLGRVYVAASQRFYFDTWDHTITRKLGVMEGIYEKLTDRVTARRLEALEWIVILLIGLELVFGFFGVTRR